MPSIDMSAVATNNAMFGPIIVLVLWTLVMWVWMYVTRIPAMQAANIDMDKANQQTPAELAGSLPANVRWKADNYNHLMEQPTIFYAAALVAAMAGLDTGLTLWCAWAFVGLRVVHSLIQATVNIIMVRFAVFTLSTVALAILAITTAIEVL